MRTPIKVDKELLASEILTADDAKPATRQALYLAAATAYNTKKAETFKLISPAVVMLRIDEWQIKLQTPIGKRGRPTGWRKDPNAPKAVKSTDGHTISEYRRAVNSFCLDCMGDDDVAIASCTAKDCPFINLRPYKTAAVETPAVPAEPAVETPAAVESPIETSATVELEEPTAEEPTAEEPETVTADNDGFHSKRESNPLFA